LAKPPKTAVFPPQAARRVWRLFSRVSGVSGGFKGFPPQTPKTPPNPPKLPPKSSQSPGGTLADFGRLSQDFDKPSQSPPKSCADFGRLCTNLHNMLHILHNMLHMSAQTCTTCCTCCTKFATTLGVVLKLVQHIYNVVHLLHNIHKHNAHHIEFVYNSFSTSVQNLHLHTICPMNPFEGKYPGGLVRQQPWPPSFACAKAETTVAGFLERQRLQFDMRAPLGRTSCFCIRTTVT